MSSDSVISVENLSKRYLVGHENSRGRYHSLRDTLVRHGKNFVRKTLEMARGQQIIQGDEIEEFWALRDVSFEVKRGEVLGIIGRNGAGKSTLLKILSRITEPTKGRVVIKGRVASLLEVGTGFHPELTGRENIFLNGAILGMSKAEIRRKFEEIVDFAGVEKFLDTPVKRYSSGMYVRLAFAVAAHLEPEILIVDEVLAVGDAEFQKKCLGKMQDVAKGGRTVLFVSHNLNAVRSLCSSALLLESGTCNATGKVEVILDKYQTKAGEVPKSLQYRFFRLNEFAMVATGGTAITTQEDVTIRISFSSLHEKLVRPDFYLAIKNTDDVLISGINHCDINGEVDGEEKTVAAYTLHIKKLNLLPGRYNVWLELKDHGRGLAEFAPIPYRFSVENGTCVAGVLAKNWHGHMRMGSDITLSKTK